MSIAADLAHSGALPAVRPAQTLDPKVVESVLLDGDLSRLTTEQRISYYNHVCEVCGLNPLTQPFSYIKLNGRLVLYALKACTDQLRMIHTVSINPTGFTREVIEGVYVVTAPASMPNGRTDVSTGAVPIDGLKGETRANAMMKAETKAKRRVTLSICGLGMLDETEVESIPPERLTIEASKRIKLPEGTCQVLKVTPKSAGKAELAEVTYVDHAGVEHTRNTTVDWKGSAAGLFEQLAQEGLPVVITTKETPRSKRTVISEVHRWKPEAAPSPTPEVIDAEVDPKRPPVIPASEIPF